MLAGNTLTERKRKNKNILVYLMKQIEILGVKISIKKRGERKGVAKHRHVMHQAYEEIRYLGKSTYAFLMDSESFYYFCIKK